MRLTRGRQSEFESFAAAQGAGLVKLAFIVCGDGSAPRMPRRRR